MFRNYGPETVRCPGNCNGRTLRHQVNIDAWQDARQKMLFQSPHALLRFPGVTPVRREGMFRVRSHL